MGSNEVFPSVTEAGGKDMIQLTKLVGDRFLVDQIPIELLSELLIVINSDKYINDGEVLEDEMFPVEYVRDDFNSMKYNVKYRLYFKLFSLWNSGKRPKNADSHENKYEEVIKRLSSSFDSDMDDNQRCIEIIANLYQGFQVAGASRDWCARSFLPVSQSILAGESIWKATKVQRDKKDFDEAVKKNFEHTGRSFYARGGEVLYLQLLLAFTKSEQEIDFEIKNNPYLKGLRVSQSEKDPLKLKENIEKGFRDMFSDGVPLAFNKFIDFVEEKNKTSLDGTFSEKENPIGYIQKETWVLGYLFALELSRLFLSKFDVIDRIQMLENECVLQVIRTLLYVSSMQLEKDSLPKIAVVSPCCEDATLKTVSNRSFLNCKTLIRKAFESVSTENEIATTDKAHKRYGYGILRKYGKEIGLIIPKKGGNEHFVLTKDILILLVSTTLTPDNSLTIESFLKDLEIRFGFVFDFKGFTKVNEEVDIKQNIYGDNLTDWLVNMLDECGYFIPLSDALSLVKNTNIREEDFV